MRVLVLLAVAVLLTGCEPPEVEPRQASPGCPYVFDGAAPLQGAVELGRVTAAGFVPFAGKEEVEIAPWPAPEGVGQWYFKDVHLRFTAPQDVGSQVCAQVSGSFDTQSLDVAEGLLLTRDAAGRYVGGPFPLTAELSLQDNAEFASRLGQPVTFTGEVLQGTSSLGPVRGSLPRLELTRVNREGFLGVAPADAGTDGGQPLLPGVLDVAASLVLLRPGEAARVTVSVSGDRRGEAVTLSAGPLPAGVAVTFGSPLLAAGQLNTVARVSVAATVGPMSIPFSLTATGATTSGTSAGGRIDVVPATSRELSVTVFSAEVSPPLGSTVSALVHLAPLGGFQGSVFLVAEAPVEVDVTLPTAPIAVNGPVDVPFQVRVKGAPLSGPVQVYAVQGHEVWGRTAQRNEAWLSFTPGAPVQSHLVLWPGFSERRVVAPGDAVDWAMQAYEVPAPGGQSNAVALSVSGTPAGCAALVPDAGASRVVRFACDAGLAAQGAAVTVTAQSAGGPQVSEAWRLTVAGAPPGLESFGVVPEARPQSLDSAWPQVAGLRNDAFTVGVASADFAGTTSDYAPLGGFAVPRPVTSDTMAVVTVGQAGTTAVATVFRSATGQLVVSGAAPGGPTSARGPFDVAGHADGTVWAATGTAAPTLRPWVGRFSGGVWTERGPPLPETPGLTDLALAVQNLSAVLVTAEPALVVRRLQGAAWTTLPALPAALLAPPADGRTVPRRVLDVAIDNTGEPVVALVTAANAVEVYRFEAGSWVLRSGVAVTPGLLPLSLSLCANHLAVDPEARLTLVWHEATHAFAAPSGARVLPRHAAQSKLRLLRHTAAGFVELPRPGVDYLQGLAEQPFVSFDRDGRPYVVFVEDGRVHVQRAPP